ncbi:MAG: hypothetical protein Q4Q28_06945 [Bacteroidales bacterium]|nr:hypothetical protein [Bacteroidales bacterium]
MKQSIKRSCLSYPLPDKRVECIHNDEAWEWTVYFRNGVWRCL